MKVLLITFSLLISGVVCSQQVGNQQDHSQQEHDEHIEECGTRIADPQEYLEFENSISQHERSTTTDCTTIRTVVHVIYNGKVANNSFNGYISPEQVKSQIRITNQSFSNDSLMYNASNTALGYKIELATTDPNGNPTTGIVYHDGYALWGEAWNSYGLKYNNPNAIPEGTVANALAWGADSNGKKYLNTYVVSSIDGNTGGGVQAYAYFPTLSVVYGNYIIFNAFGARDLQGGYGQTFNLKSYTDLGFTWTHELLHNFGLFHTFQGNSCASEINPNTQGDRVADTPPQTQGSGCSGACGTLSYNVMDYISQSCKNKITPGQVTRANAAIQQNLLAYLVCSSGPITNPSGCPGKTSDFNGDGIVNILDIAYFITAFGSIEGNAKYKAKFDLNCDGRIDIFDLLLIDF